jgi:hypothetical protein
MAFGFGITSGSKFWSKSSFDNVPATSLYVEELKTFISL